MSSAYERLQQRKKNDTTKASSEEKSTSTAFERLQQRKKQNEYNNTIGFDTLESDINSLAKSIQKVYDGWQTEETMNNTRSSIEAMQTRVNAYQDYRKTYGNKDSADLTDLLNSYKSTLEGWDDLKYHYSKYKNADDYNKALAESEAYQKELDSMPSADLNVVQTEIDELQKILDTAKSKKPKTNLTTSTKKGRGAIVQTQKKVAEQKAYDEYLKSVGYSSIEEIEETLSKKKVYKNKAQRVQDGISLSSVADEKSENYDPNFDDYSAKGTALGNEETDEWYISGYKNQVAYLRNNPEALEQYFDIADDNGTMVESILDNQLPAVAAKYMNDDEAKLHDYYVYLESQGLAEEGTATKYLRSIEEKLKQRQGTDVAKEREGLLSKYSFGYKAGIDQFTQGFINAFNTEDDYIPATAIQNASAQFREDIDKAHGIIGQGVYDLITTTSNMAPSILASTLVGMANPVAGQVVGATLMGTSASGNAYQEMLNQGYDKSQARTYATLTGISEAGLQYAFGGIGKLGGKLTSKTITSIANGVDNAIGRFAIKYGMNMAAEGFEEAAQEVLNPFFENLALGYSKNDLTDIEWSEVAYSGVLGALSAGFLEGGSTAVSTFGENATAKKTGANIRANNQISGMLDIASLSQEETDAYNLYTQYAKKGVNAENISDLQLGRLHHMASADAQNTLTSKKSTTEQKVSALKTMQNLGEMGAENVALKRANEFTKGEETKVTNTNTSTSIEEIKIGEDDTTIVTNDGEVSVNDMTFTQRDAELIGYAELIGKEYSETEANLFLAQDDGQTDVSNYANSFNLVMAYAKHNFTQETILENKGSLSTSQVNAIYEATVVREYKAKENALKTLAEKQGNKMFIQGVFDDSIIDYKSGTKDGSKVNWNTLTSTQRAAINFAKLFSKATGVNIKFIKSDVVKGKHKGKNGSYDPNTNTIEIDVYAGRIDAQSVKDSIIPTLSHEITHWMKNKSPAIYNSIREDVIKTLKKGRQLSSVELVAEEVARLDKKHPNKKHTPEDAIDELVARACEDMLSNSNAARKLLNKMSAKEQQSFIEKVKETFDNLIQWVNDLLSHYKSSSKEAEILRDYKAMLKKISKQWDEMLVDAIQNNQVLQNKGVKAQKYTVEGDEQFCSRDNSPNAFNPNGKTLNEQLSDAYETSESFDQRYIYVGRFSQDFISLLKENDMELYNYPIAMNYRDAYLSMHSKETGKYQGTGINYHNLGVEGLQEALESFKKPDHIIKSKKDGKIELVLQCVDKKGNSVLSIIAINTVTLNGNKMLDAHIVTSTYGRRNINKYIDVARNEGRLIEPKKEESTQGIPQVQYEGNINANSSKDIIHQNNPKSQEKSQNSDRDTDDYSRIQEMQTELNQIRQTIIEMQNSEEFKTVHDNLSKAMDNGDVESGIKAYKEWQETSGYAELSQKRDALQLELENLRKSFEESITNENIKKEQEAIAKSGLSEAEYFRKQAVKEFGYTPYFYDAGYITPNGKMLNFSGEKGKHYGTRGQDHRAIGIIYADTHMTAALNRFVKDGNIRIMAESPGIDISTLVEPTTEQYSTIRKFIYEYANREYFNVDLTDENGNVIGSLEYENHINPTRIINDIKHYYATGEIRGQSEIDKFRYSDRDETIDTQINQSMTMNEAKDMIQRAFVLGGIQEWYDGEYKNGDEWLRAQGADEVALYIENEYALQQKYLDKIQGILDDEFYVQDILNAYLNGTLTGKEKPKTKRLDISKEYRVNDKRFYSPQRIKDVKKLLNVASQRVTNQNRAEVSNARAKILLFAHNKGASELLGLTQSELNKKLRVWSGYPAGARETSKRFNNNVADSNKWTGIENCSWLYKSTVTTKELESLVKEIKGAASDYEKLYIARTMLALDTHIDWSWLSFEFDTYEGVNKSQYGDGKCNGYYRNDARKIVVSHNKPNTVAHEMGHALDYQWARDLGYLYDALTEVSRNTKRITDADTKQFFDNFKIFIDSLTDNGDIRSEYTQNPKEVFARFVARFIEWVDNTGTGRKTYNTEFLSYNDKFTASNYIEFVKLLQEKAMLDAKRMEMETNEDVQFADRDTEGNELSKGQIDFFKDSKVRDENGNLKVMWHGTSAKFTIFDIGKAGSNWGGDSRLGKGFYFANTKEEAMEWGKSTNVIKAYLNLVNPLDYTEPTPKNISKEIDKYVEKLLAKYDENTYFITREQYKDNLQRIKEMYLKDASLFVDTFKYDDNGNMTDGIREFLSGLGYDGIVSKDEVVAFYPEQIKETSNKNPTSNPDMMYADREEVNVYEIMGENARLIKENERFAADVERLKERLKIERQVTHGNYFNENQLNTVAGHLRRIANTAYDKVELMKQLKDVYSYIAHSDDLNWEDLFSKCYAVAKNMLAERKDEIVVNDYFKEMLRDIRKRKISLNPKQIEEAKFAFGNDYHKFLFGKLNIAKDGLDLDIAWKDWASKYPRFDAELSDGDQITELYKIYEEAKEGSEMVAEYNEEETARWLANEIYNQYWNVSPIRTTADKYDKKIKLLNFEHRRTMKEMRDGYNERLAAQKKADREKYQRLAQEIRERKDRKIAEVKRLGKERMDKYKENAERKTKIQSITANALTLNKWITTNSKDYHIHEAMKAPVIALLQAIDFSSKRLLDKNTPTQKDVYLSKALSKVKDMMADATNLKEGLEELYGHDMDEELAALVDSVDNIALSVGNNEYVLNRMSLEELKTLDKLVRTIKHTVTKLNKFHTVHHNKGAVNLANDFMEYGDKLGKLKKQDGRIGKFLKFRNCTPYYFFKRLGEAGSKLFEAFQDGWDKLAFNSKQIIDFTEKTYTNKEVREWTKNTKKFTFDINGESRTFEMSVAQIMALHCVAKQEDAQRHLLSGGMTLSRLDKKGNVVADYENIPLGINEIFSILATLTDRQKEVADKLQEFMNTICSDWGNEISMARFGVNMFGMPNYFPIKVSPTTIPTDNTKEFDNASLFRLLNMSFTKSRNEYANQSIEIGDIFDIFAQHTTDMAKYNALALPVLDFNKFYSIKGKTEANVEYGVDRTLRTVFGNEAVSYVKRFVRDINGSQNVSRDVIGKTFFKNAKVAAVAGNLRVILLQPTAYIKAGAVMDNKYLLKAKAYMKVNPISMKGKYEKAIAKAEKYCGIVQWKSLGYYDTDISKGIAEKVKHAETFKDKAIEKSLKGAEIADKVTFGTLWTACEFEIKDNHKDLKVGSEEYYQAVAKRLR